MKKPSSTPPPSQKEDSETNAPLPYLQRNWVKNLLTAVFFIALYLAIRPFMQGDVAEGVAPTLQTESITGKAIHLKDYQGKPVMVHFWATWCPICEFERDGIEAIAKDYAVINIATQSNDDEGLLTYANVHNMNADIIVNDFDGTLMKQFGARAVPATFIIGPEGKIEFVEVGYSTSLGLKARLWWLSQ
ncbi:redoxin domain-containing protein [Hydrogenovibrio sp. 3SP14C1]|uniref:redoxin domain-containing protein n=1 Tax=Hydrogenovibrio sp. 3SP14C1 TaxID=3038774 RepID=UPI00241756A0|nr:redoxin domain-containing protein [Hydrogenovibrio sp. 3SP14C1]MDG4812327.1 redoxin domain-containing protein [Hydrogenovibrio sp. 3SP14C1]